MVSGFNSPPLPVLSQPALVLRAKFQKKSTIRAVDGVNFDIAMLFLKMLMKNAN